MPTLAFGGLSAIVTGGSSGIGRAVATMLTEQGASVASLDIDPRSDGDVIGIECDVSDAASVRLAVANAADQLGGIDIGGCWFDLLPS